MESPSVPAGYLLANTYFSNTSLRDTQDIIERSIQDVFVASPDKLCYMCRIIFNHSLFHFHIVLFHSEFGEFIEVKYLGSDTHTFLDIEIQLMHATHFTPSPNNRIPSTSFTSDSVPSIELALYLTIPDASYSDLISGIRMCSILHSTHETLIQRLTILIHDTDSDIHTLAFYALSLTPNFHAVASIARSHSDPLVRLIADRSL